MTKQELKAKIDKLENGIKSKATPSNLIAPLKAQKSKLEKELEEMEAAEKKAVKTKKVSKVAEKIKAAKKSVAKKTSAKAPAKEERKKDNIARDGDRKSLPAGKRISKTGKVYYEMRANRTDKQTSKKPYLADGGKLPNGKYQYEKGDEGMFDGDEVRVTKYHVGYNHYEYDIIDENGKVIRHGGAANQKAFERRFRYFPKMANGGATEEGVDLFEDYENIPTNVQEVLDKYSDAFEDGDYRKLEKANNELKKIGYTFEYGLDGEAYDLRKIGQKGKMDEDEYANGGEVSKKYVVFFTRFNNGKSVPRVVEMYDNESDAKEYVEIQKKLGEKGFKIKQAKDMPIYSMINIVDKSKYKELKDLIHSKDKVDAFFDGKDSFYKKDYGWVKPYGYVWENWKLVSAPNETMAKGGAVKKAPMIYEFKAILRDEDDKIIEKKEFKVRATARDSAYNKAYKKYPRPYFVELYNSYSADKMADGGDIYDDMEEDIDFANDKAKKIVNSLESLGYKVVKVHEADYDTDAQIYLSEKVNIQVGLEGDLSIVIEKEEGKFTYIDCGKSYATLLIKLSNIDKQYMEKGGKTKRTVKLTLSDKDSYDYTYKQDGATASITFGFGKEPFQYEVKKISKSLEPLQQDILDTFTLQGIKQHEYKGGFSEAIKHLDTAILENADEFAKGGVIKISLSDIEGADFQSLSQIFESNDTDFSVDEDEEFVLMDLKGLPDGEDKETAMGIIGKYKVRKMADGGKLKIGDIVIIKNPLPEEDPNQLYVVIQEDIEKFSDDEQIDIQVLNEDNYWNFPPIVRVEKKDLEIVYDVESYKKMADGGKTDEDIDLQIEKDMNSAIKKRDEYQSELKKLLDEKSQDSGHIEYLSYEIESLNKLAKKLHDIRLKRLRDKALPKGNPFKKMAYGGNIKSENELKNNNMNYAEGGELNLAVRKMASQKGLTPKKLGADYELIMAQAAVDALTDANYHDAARKLVSILENKPEIAEKPDYPSVSDPDFKVKMGAINEKYDSKYWHGDEKTRDFAVKVSQSSGWDGNGIAGAFEYLLRMEGYHRLADKIKKSVELSDADKIADFAYTNDIYATGNSFQDFSRRVKEKSGINYSEDDLQIAYNILSNARYAKGGYMADGGKLTEKYNVSFNYNPSILKNEDAEKIVEKYTKDWRHNNDWDEVSFYVMRLNKSDANMLVKELKMEDAYNFEVDKSNYASGGYMATGGDSDEPSDEMEKLVEEHINEAKRNRVKITNLGSNQGDDFIVSKTTQRKDGSDVLTSEISNGLVTHDWDSYKKGGYMADGGEVKKVTDGDDTYYLTYIDSTHFYLSNSKDYKGNAFHIAEFRSRPFYDEVKSWLKSYKGEMMATGGKVPAHFGSGKNIEVFGYQTENFDICATAVKEFESAMEIMQNAKESEKESLARCAKYVDGLFGIEKQVVENSGTDDANFYEAVSDIMSASIYNYRAEMSINLFSFVPQHLKEIAIRMEKAEKGGLYALGGMTAGRWYRDKSGEEFKFIGKIDSGENKGKFLFTDGQKSVYKDLEDFEGGRPKETKLFGFFEDGGSVAEGNYEMLMSNIKAIKHHAEELEGAVTPNTEIEAWVLSKSERAETDLSDITHYLDGLKMAKGGYMADGGKVDVKDLTYPKYEVSKPEFEAGFGKGKFKFPDKWEVGGFRFDKEKDANAFYDKLKGIDNMSDYLEINTIKMQDFFDKKYQPSEYKEPKVGSPYPFSAFQKAKHKQQFQFLEVKGGEEYTIDFVLDKVVLDKALGWRKFGNEWIYGDYIYDFEGYASVGSGAIKLILVKTMEKGGYMAKGGNTNYTKTWKVVGRTMQGKLFEKEITLGRMSDRNDVMNALKRMPNTQIREITFIGERFKAAEGGMMAKGGLTKESIKRTLTSDTNQYFLEKDNDGYILYISPKGAMNSTFHDKFNVEDLGTDGTRMKYKLTKLENGGFMAKGGETNDYDGEKYRVADVYFNDRRGELFIVTESKPSYIVVKYKDGFVAKHTKEELKELKESGDLDYIGKNIDLLDKYIFKDAFYKGKMADGGKVKFADKVKSVQESLLKRKKVAPQVQKDYGKTYSKAEAKESAQRIVGSRMAQLKEKMAKKKK